MKHLRTDFPILKQKINEQLLCYVDNASTSQKPQQVLDALIDFYTKYNANIYRGVHTFGEKATLMYEQARKKVAQFIGASDASEVIFTHGTTESINFIASTWAQQHINPGDDIIITQLEHHANLLPWQQVARVKGAHLNYIPVFPDGTLDINVLDNLITPRTKIIAVSHVSNAVGTHVDIATIIHKARKVGAKVLVDAAQSVAHQKIDVKKIDCDFLAFSGHKILGPTGIGVLYIKKELHDLIPPYQVGGGIVYEASMETASWLQSPQKFEAGTPPIAQAIGLGAAIDYIEQKIDFDELQKHEAALTSRLLDGLLSISGIRVLGPIEQLKQTGHMVSFVVDKIHAHDVAAYLDSRGICVRAGNHCAQPLAKKLGYLASVRISFYAYNTLDEVERILCALDELVKNF